MILERMIIELLVILKTSECNSTETTNIYSNLSDQTKIISNEIKKNQGLFQFWNPRKKNNE